MNRSSILLFVVLAFVVAWAIWFGVAVFRLPRNLIFLVNFVPAAAAFLVRGPLRREGFRDAGLSPIGGQRLIQSYATAYFLPLLLFGGVAALALINGVGRVTLFERLSGAGSGLGGGQLVAEFGLAPLAVLTLLSPLLLTFVTVGEEIGWRGHLLVRLLPMGRARAVVVTGTVWATWHLPFNVLFGANGGVAGFPLFLAFAVLFGAFLAWLRLRSGSVWPAAVAHAGLNSLSSLMAFTLGV